MNVFLDDERNPSDITWNTVAYNQYVWVVVRDFDSFQKAVMHSYDMGETPFISFDHDIGTQESGFDCAKWLVDYCLDHHYACPVFEVHSKNIVGATNIRSLLHHFQRHQSQELSMNTHADNTPNPQDQNPQDQERSIYQDLADIIRRDDARLLANVLIGYPQVASICNINHRTLMHEAAEVGSWGCLSTLAAHDLDLNASDVLGQTPLHRALTRQHEGAAEWLINNGADLNKPDFYGVTPVLLAAEWRTDMLTLLVSKGGDESVVDKQGFGVEDWALQGTKKALRQAQIKKLGF